MNAHPQRRQNRRHRLQLLGAGALLLVAGGVLGGLIAHNVSVSAARPPAPARAGTAPTISTAPAAVASALDEAREQAISRVRPAIVEVQNVGVGLGSGIILRSDGYIVTNDHVVANGSRYTVTLPNGPTLTARIVPQIIQYGRVLHSGRPYLGIVHATVTATLQKQYHLPVSSGVLVAGLAAHGPAQQAGLTPGDVIVTFNATAITSYNDLLTALANEQPGERVRVSVVHPSGQHQTYTITLGQLPINGNGYD